MVREIDVDLVLDRCRILEGPEPGRAETWSARVTLSGGPLGRVTARGEAAGLRGLTADFWRDAGTWRKLTEPLRDLLFPPEVEDAFVGGLVKDLRADDRLRVRVRCDEPAFTALPWEVAGLAFPHPTASRRDQGDQLQLPLVNGDFRQITVARIVGDGGPPRRKEPLRALVVDASAADGPIRGADGLLLGEVRGTEEQARESAWTAADAGAALERIGASGLLVSADRKSLTERLHGITHIVCIVAHGLAGTPERTGIVLHGPDGTSPELLPARELGALLHEAGTLLAVLVSCNTAGGSTGWGGWGSTVEQLLAGGVPAVVAMQSAMGRRAGDEFLPRLVKGLVETGEIHGALAHGLGGILEERAEHLLGVPALYTGPQGLRLLGESAPDTPGTAHAYPVSLAGKVGGEDRRVRLDVVWALDRGPFAGVLLDPAGHDLAADLDQWEASWDDVLRARQLPVRRWFTAQADRRPPTGDDWQARALDRPGEWHRFREQFPPDTAEVGWVLRAALPDRSEEWVASEWERRIEPWYRRLSTGPEGLSGPVIVVLHGEGRAALPTGLAALSHARIDLSRRSGLPVTAVTRWRPGRVGPPGQAVHTWETPSTVSEQSLADARLQDPTAYQKALVRLAAGPDGPGRRGSLAVAADYDDDIQRWCRAALEARRPLPTPTDLPLSVTPGRADSIVLALLRLDPAERPDLTAWTGTVLSRPVSALVRRVSDTRRGAAVPDEGMADWLARNPASAPAAERAGLNPSPAEVLRRLPPGAAPWAMIGSGGATAEVVELLLGGRLAARLALGLVTREERLLPQRFEERSLTDSIRALLGRETVTDRQLRALLGHQPGHPISEA